MVTDLGLLLVEHEIDFFPSGNAQAAKRICGRCLVRHECLDFAVAENITEGIWGGLSERERRKVRATVKARELQEVPRVL